MVEGRAGSVRPQPSEDRAPVGAVSTATPTAWLDEHLDWEPVDLAPGNGPSARFPAHPLLRTTRPSKVGRAPSLQFSDGVLAGAEERLHVVLRDQIRHRLVRAMAFRLVGGVRCGLERRYEKR